MNKIAAIAGAIILVIGAALMGIGYTGMMNESMENLADDYDEATGQFESYDEGDTVTVTGEITRKDGGTFFGDSAYRYELDDVDSIGFLTGEDIGDEGDRITVTLEITELSGSEVLQGQSYSNPTWMSPISLVGIVLMIVGVIIAIIGAVTGGKEEELPPPQQQTTQPHPSQEDEGYSDEEEEF